MFKVILAAVDGSERARGVVTAALELAERFDGRVHLFRAVSVPQQFPAAAHMPADTLPQFLEQETRRELSALAGGHPRITLEPPELNPLQPWRAIIAAAAGLNADLIVVGSHGYSGWDRIIGTNASKVADHADRNVLVVHERSRS